MSIVVLHTTAGDIKIELEDSKTPVTCENFIRYVKEGFYSQTIFHRVIDGFMIQGGGLTEDMENKEGNDPIENEADKGIENKKGTIAMARTTEPHSASSQFFINANDNDFLNFTSKSREGWGYCAFGRVIDGMDVVEEINKVKTTSRNFYDDVPEEAIIIESAEVLAEAEATA